MNSLVETEATMTAPKEWLRNVMAQAGVRAATSVALTRAKNLAAPAFYFGVVRFVRWDLKTSARRPVPPGFTARELRLDELGRVAELFGHSAGSFYRRARLGDRCFASFRDGASVNIRWCAVRPVRVPELDVYAVPGPAEVYFYAATTLPAFRGQGAAAATRQAIEATLLSEGRLTGHAYVAIDNFASLKTQHDFHEVYDIPYLRLWGCAAHLRGNLRPPYYREEDIPAPEGTSATTGAAHGDSAPAASG